MSNWEDRWNRALREQHRLLFDYDKKTIKEKNANYADCPICGQNDATSHFEKDWFKWVRCRNCSMVYMYPRLTDAATHQFYNSEANDIYNESKFYEVSGSSTFDNRANITNLNLINRKKGSAKDVLLEIGSGNGFFLQKAKEAGYQVHGIELNKKNCQYSRKLLGESNSILNVDLLEAHYPSAMFDVIYMRDLIQHIPDPKVFLQECRRVAKPGCTLFIGTHNIEGLLPKIIKSKYTPVFGFMEPNHYSPRSISKILELTGFAVKTIKFESIDCTISNMISYLIKPTFTTIFPEEINQKWPKILRLIQAVLARWPFHELDILIIPQFASWMKLGSWMNILAEKVT